MHISGQHVRFESASIWSNWRRFRLLMPVLIVCATAACAAAQPAPGAATQDPLMALMLNQPRIDVDSPVVPEAAFDPPAVRPGQDAVYRLNFNALETSVALPARIPGLSAAQYHPGAHGQLLVFTGTNYQPRASFNFRVRASETGTLVVPEFKVRVYDKEVKVPSARLNVVRELPPGTPPAHSLRLELPVTNVYIGQAVHASITLPPSTSLVIQQATPFQVNGQGFLLDPNTIRPGKEIRRLGNQFGGFPSQAYDLVLTPISVGQQSIFAQAFVGSRLAQPIVMPVAGLPSYILVDSPQVDVRVLPLPREGQLPGFTGAVGTFTAESPLLVTNVLQVGQPVRLAVRIHGDGNLLRLVPPPVPTSPQWRIFAGEVNATHPQIIQAQGFTVFNYTLVPLSASARQTPEIPFSCFDPDEGRYLDCTIPSTPVTVLPGATPADLKVVQEADAAAGKPEKEPVLSGLAAAPGLGSWSLVPLQRQTWFPFLQIAPAIAFLGLWTWDRRRRYFEAHPDVLLRRRARRELHRQWKLVRRAAASKDSGRFASAAVRALDIACSPFYPADPQALVGADVLALLDEPTRSGHVGRAVRDIFDAWDASRFSGQAGAPSSLVGLQPEIDELLAQLDERLRA